MESNIAQIFGQIDAPPGVTAYGGFLGGLRDFINNLIRLTVVVAGIYAFINILLAGFAFMSAGDDPKKIAAAWQKIWQTFLGLGVAAGAFVLAAIFGQILFKDPNALLQLRFFTP